MRKVLFVLLCFPLLVQAQQSDSVKQYDLVRFADGFINTYTTPVKWKGNDWLKLGGVLAGTAVISAVDIPVRNFWIRQESPVLDHINTAGNHYGKPYTGFTLAGGLYLTGLVIRNQWAKETGMILGTSLLTAGLIESALKPAVGRARPEQEEGNYKMDFFSKERSFHSFPSGHASMAFTASFVMARRVRSVPLKILFYSLAGSTAVCRLYSDAHWLSDVVFGSAIAWFCSDFAIKRFEANRFRKGHNRLKWNVTPLAKGLSLSASF